MIYSVWDHARRVYDYYDAPNAQLDAATQPPAPSHLRGSQLGAVPEAAAWPLPSSAQPIGSGKYPKGMIASRSSGGLGLGFVSLDLTISNVAILGGLGYLVWKYVLPEIRRRS